MTQVINWNSLQWYTSFDWCRGRTAGPVSLRLHLHSDGDGRASSSQNKTHPLTEHKNRRRPSTECPPPSSLWRGVPPPQIVFTRRLRTPHSLSMCAYNIYVGDRWAAEKYLRANMRQDHQFDCRVCVCLSTKRMQRLTAQSHTRTHAHALGNNRVTSTLPLYLHACWAERRQRLSTEQDTQDQPIGQPVEKGDASPVTAQDLSTSFFGGGKEVRGLWRIERGSKCTQPKQDDARKNGGSAAVVLAPKSRQFRPGSVKLGGKKGNHWTAEARETQNADVGWPPYLRGQCSLGHCRQTHHHHTINWL